MYFWRKLQVDLKNFRENDTEKANKSNNSGNGILSICKL